MRILKKTRRKRKYKKIKDRENVTPLELIRDLKIRSGYYSREARTRSINILRINRALTFLSFIVSAFVGFILISYYNKLFTDFNITLYASGLSFLIALIAIFQVFLFDGVSAAKLLHISQQFYDIREEMEHLLARYHVRGYSEEELLNEYNKLYSLYNERRDKYVEHIRAHHRYYHIRGAGRNELPRSRAARYQNEFLSY